MTAAERLYIGYEPGRFTRHLVASLDDGRSLCGSAVQVQGDPAYFATIQRLGTVCRSCAVEARAS